jgi:DMSO/TMAO reductase YedYZ molybdopterin-dependent catalytic subunit
MNKISRRKWLAGGIAVTGASGLAVAGKLASRYGLIPPDHSGMYGAGHALTYASQRLLTANSFAREFPRDQISKAPFVTGRPLQDDAFKQLQASGFSAWRLAVDGMVAHPGSFSLSDLKSYPLNGQITHLACEEGWSFIAEWFGVRLSRILQESGIQPDAKYVVYTSLESGLSDSIDMADALHPQTLITYGMNGRDLPVAHGGPIRLRLPRQLGYKSMKYLTRITVVDSLKGFVPGDYSWYAGI